MSRKTSENQKLGSSAGIPVRITVPAHVEVHGAGAAGEAIAKELNSGREVHGGIQARVIVADLVGAVEAVGVAGAAADDVKTWIALLTDGTEGTELGRFEQALSELDSEVVDLVLLVDPKQASELIAAWAVTKAKAPASVLSRLPDSEGSSCHYVALTGVAVAGTGETESVSPVAGDDGRALANSMSEFVRDCADEVRGTREKLAAAVAVGSAGQALSASGELDSAIDSLKERCLEGLDAEVGKFVDGAARSVDESGSQTSEVDLEALTKARTVALSEFVLANSKGGLGKLFAKAKLKRSGDELLKATDSYVNGQGTELIDELTELAQPLVDEAREDQLQQAIAEESSNLVKQARAAASKLELAKSGKAAKISRSWTSGSPAPRNYLLVSNLVHPTLNIDEIREASFFALPAGELDGAYVLQAQYALSKASVAAQF